MYSKCIGGGSLGTTDHINNDTITISSEESISTAENNQWFPTPHNEKLQINMTRYHHPNEASWIPEQTLKYQYQDHPLLNTIQKMRQNIYASYVNMPIPPN
jgi:hypothetical protein